MNETNNQLYIDRLTDTYVKLNSRLKDIDISEVKVQKSKIPELHILYKGKTIVRPTFNNNMLLDFLKTKDGKIVRPCGVCSNPTEAAEWILHCITNNTDTWEL